MILLALVALMVSMLLALTGVALACICMSS